MFKCRTCGTEKPTTDFYKEKSKRGHRLDCKKCNNQARKERNGVSCTECGKAMWRSFGSLAEVPVCNPCRQKKWHVTVNRYRKGCRCDGCKAMQKIASKKYHENYRARHGVLQCTMWRKKNVGPGAWDYLRWIDPKKRNEIYERDNWTCHLCDEPVDREADKNSNQAPSLEHLVPRSQGGSDDEQNLKTAHRICNARRQDQPLAS